MDRSSLLDVYLNLWFGGAEKSRQFTLGEISFERNKNAEWELGFANGRHRTNLLIKHQWLIPICLIGQPPAEIDIELACVKELHEGDIIEIPDLPIKRIDEIRQLARPIR